MEIKLSLLAIYSQVDMSAEINNEEIFAASICYHFRVQTLNFKFLFLQPLLPVRISFPFIFSRRFSICFSLPPSWL